MDDRTEAIDILTRMSTNHFYGHREQEAFKLGAEALSAERHGKWIDAECYSEGCDNGYICSECRRITYRTMTPYCPNCGAKMECE